jgi:hypothetical protein
LLWAAWPVLNRDPFLDHSEQAKGFARAQFPVAQVAKIDFLGIAWRVAVGKKFVHLITLGRTRGADG